MLDRPENFWGLRNCPKDWLALPAAPAVAALPQTLPATANSATRPISGQLSHSSEVVLGQVARQVSEEYVKRMIAESVSPLQAEVVALKEKLLRADSNRSRFEVSLSSIPPELEQQLELRLRKDLGPRVLDEARQQSGQLLAAAQSAIDQKTTEAHDHFLHRVAEELQLVEQRAQDLSAYIARNVREHVRGGLQDFQQQLADGSEQLKRLSQELLEFMQRSLNDEHHARRGEMEQLRADIASESSRLHEDIEDLNTRVAKLHESARSLETGLDQRLSQMASNTVKETRNQLESAAGDILRDLNARGGQAIKNQLDEACENMKIVQKGIVASVSESLKVEARDALQGFERSMENLARLSIERWRIKLTSGLNAVVNSLGEQLKLEAKSLDGDSGR